MCIYILYIFIYINILVNGADILTVIMIDFRSFYFFCLKILNILISHNGHSI